MTRLALAPVLLSALSLTACGPKIVDVAPVTVAASPVAPPPMPQPPAHAAQTVVLPPQGADGGFVTPNTAVSGPAAVWHLRAAFNVAALGCAGGTLVPAYNRLLATHRAALADAHRALRVEYGTDDAFDAGMTRLYNYFALPPAQAGYCRAAAAVLASAATWPAGSVGQHAPGALAAIDRPFTDFFNSYAAYRADLARWRAGSVAPRLDYDVAALLATDDVAGGRVRVAAR